MKWEETTIGKTCNVGDGAHASIKRYSDGIPYLTSKNFKIEGLDLKNVEFISSDDFNKYFKKDSKAITKPGKDDVLLSIIGSLGAPYQVKEEDEFGLSSSVSILRPKETIDSTYLYYWIKSTEFQSSIMSFRSGVAQSFLSLGVIKDLPISLQYIHSIFTVYSRLFVIYSLDISLVYTYLSAVAATAAEPYLIFFYI